MCTYLQGEQGPPGQPGPPGPPGELPMLPPELAGFQQSALARWRRELNDINADDEGEETTTSASPEPGDGDDGPKYVDIVSSIYGMRQDLERIRKPVGTRENPVMTCKDLFYGHPQFKDGKSLVEVNSSQLIFVHFSKTSAQSFFYKTVVVTA